MLNESTKKTLIAMVGEGHANAVADYLQKRGWNDDQIHSEFGLWKHPSGTWMFEIAATDGLVFKTWDYENESYDKYIERMWS